MRLSPRTAASSVLAVMLIASLLGLRPEGTTADGRFLDVRVFREPAPVIVDGAARLVYELQVTSYASTPLQLRMLNVLDAHTGDVITGLSGRALTDVVAQFGSAQAADPLTVSPGSRVVIYLEIDFPNTSGDLPRALVHRIDYTSSGATLRVDGPPVALDDDPPPVLAPPIRGGPWVAAYHPSWPRGHRRVYYVVDGRARIPGRFAIDWFLVDAQGRAARGDGDVVANWIGHGVDVLAVADAQVVALRDDLPESQRISTYTRPAREDATGNYIALDLGNGRYAFYEHLMPGSVRVAVGQHVRRGDVIAALGYTGSTGSPHLHFHLADANSPLGAEGEPFVLDCFNVLGAYTSIDSLGVAPWVPSGGPRRTELPAPNTVVDFGCTR